MRGLTACMFAIWHARLIIFVLGREARCSQLMRPGLVCASRVFTTLVTDVRFSAHLLRVLLVHHWLREVSPDVFTNNRLSSMIDTGKTIEQLRDAYVLRFVPRSFG